MTIDKAQLRLLAQAVADLEDIPERADEHAEAKDALWLHMHCHTILGLLAEIDQLKLALDMESAELAWSDSDGRAIQAERDQLKAELAGLRTGYDAQNSVIADYKSGQDRYEQIIEDLKAEGVTLRKALSECIQSLSEEMLGKYCQAPEDMHPSNRRRYDLEMEELAGYRAAMTKEEPHGQ